MERNVDILSFGDIAEKEIQLIKLKNQNNTVFECITYGAIWHSLVISDKKDGEIDVIVAPQKIKGYVRQHLNTPYYFGACIGRYSGRISDARFKLNDTLYELDQKNGIHLHGGCKGLDQKIWKIEQVKGGVNPAVTLSCTSPHLENGYPGTLKVNVTYTLTETNQVVISYDAISNEDTVLNLTNHAYFNLSGKSILNDTLRISSDAILELDAKKIPTGKLVDVSNTLYDFKKHYSLDKISQSNGLDDVFVLNNKSKSSSIEYFSKNSKLRMTIQTNQPAVVVFAPKTIDFSDESKKNISAKLPYPAICFETQNYPDAPNQPSFPSSILKKNSKYESHTIYSFDFNTT